MTIEGDKVRQRPVTPEKRVMFPCKATKDCEGRYAVVENDVDVIGEFGYSGRRARYRCLTCNRTFTIRH